MVAVVRTHGTLPVPPDLAPTVSGSDHGFRSDIQALRALAVGLVVLDHIGVPGLAGGFIGVDVFFVISGFLITGLLIRERERTGRVSILAFYARRVRRIMPAASLVLIVTVVASYHWLGSITGDRTATDAQWAAAFLANIHFLATGTTYLGAQVAPSTLQHFWSLAVEEQFYVVWPALFIALAALAAKSRSKAYLIVPMALVMTGSYVYSIIETANSAKAAYFSPLTRACELAAGVVLALCGPALARIGRRLGSLLTAVGLAGIALAAFALDETTAFPGAVVALPVLATCAVLAGGAAASTGPLGTLFRFPPVQRLGLWSYSLYLWHWPLITITEQTLNHPLSPLVRILLVTASIIVAALSYMLVENPARNARALRVRPVLCVLGGIALVVGIVAGCALVRVGDSSAASTPERRIAVGSTPAATVAEVESLVAAASKITKVPTDLVVPVTAATRDTTSAGADGCLLSDYAATKTDKACVYGDPKGTRTLVLFGDSHAGMWLGVFDAAGRREHIKIQVFAKSACAVPTLHYWLEPVQRKNTECDTYRDWAINRINTLKPSMVVLTSAWFRPRDFDKKYFTEAQGAAGTRTTLTRLKPSGAKLIIVGDIPYLAQSAPECLSAHMDAVQNCALLASKAIFSAHVAEEKQTAESVGARYVDVTPWFCTSICEPIIGNMIVYRDQYHVSATYANHLSAVLVQAAGI